VPGDVGKVVAIYSSGAWDMFEFSVCFWGFGLGVPTYKKKARSTHRPFGRSSLKDPTVGFCCESRPCAQGSCQIWMKVDHIMIFVMHGLYAPDMPHAPMLHLPTVAFPNS
jgi:hypothetical protein